MPTPARPTLAQLVEVTPAGVAIDVSTTAPGHAGGKASFIRVVSISTPKPPATGNQLCLELANGESCQLTVCAHYEKWVEYTAIGKNTTCGPVQVGWY